jgi:hypothetical protein
MHYLELNDNAKTILDIHAFPIYVPRDINNIDEPVYFIKVSTIRNSESFDYNSKEIRDADLSRIKEALLNGDKKLGV